MAAASEEPSGPHIHGFDVSSTLPSRSRQTAGGARPPQVLRGGHEAKWLTTLTKRFDDLAQVQGLEHERQLALVLELQHERLKAKRVEAECTQRLLARAKGTAEPEDLQLMRAEGDAASHRCGVLEDQLTSCQAELADLKGQQAAKDEELRQLRLKLDSRKQLHRQQTLEADKALQKAQQEHAASQGRLQQQLKAAKEHFAALEQDAKAAWAKAEEHAKANAELRAQLHKAKDRKEEQGKDAKVAAQLQERVSAGAIQIDRLEAKVQELLAQQGIAPRDVVVREVLTSCSIRAVERALADQRVRTVELAARNQVDELMRIIAGYAVRDIWVSACRRATEALPRAPPTPPSPESPRPETPHESVDVDAECFSVFMGVPVGGLRREPLGGRRGDGTQRVTSYL